MSASESARRPSSLQRFVLFPDPEHHLGNLTLQNGKLAFLRRIDDQMLFAVQHSVDLFRNPRNPAVARCRKSEEQRCQTDVGQEHPDSRRYKKIARRRRRHSGDQKAQKSETEYFSVSQHYLFPPSRYPIPRTVMISSGSEGSSSIFSAVS